MSTTQYTKVHHVLPKEVLDIAPKVLKMGTTVRNAYIISLREAGWSLQSIGDVFDLTRERVRQLTGPEAFFHRDPNVASVVALPVPFPPLRPVIEPKVVKDMSPEALERALELQPFAQSVRSNSPMYREEAEEYTKILYNEHTVGEVPLSRIASSLGITAGALRFRFARYGYTPRRGSMSSSKCYKPIVKKNRFSLSS